MLDQANRTFICSVVFIDLVGYSKKPVTEQIRLKTSLTSNLSEAIKDIPVNDRIILDTGDGAAISFLGDPADALFVTLSLREAMVREGMTSTIVEASGEDSVRMGINLGPVKLVKDINGHPNIIGDGINVAQRIMSFAGSGELMVSRQFYDIVSRLSDDYASMFKPEGSRTDKHERAYDVYSVSKAVRVGRRVAGDQLKLKKKRRSGPDTTFTGMDRTPAQVFDAGTHYMVSGYSEESVRDAAQKLIAGGGKLIAPLSQMGRKWLASVSNPKLDIEAKVEELGFKRVVTGPTREAVQLAVQDLVERGSTLVQEPELAEGVWTAVCEKTGG